jgi:hypothetical protein
VTKVYSISRIRPDDSIGTTNPYFTARPLANIVMNLDPIEEPLASQDSEPRPPCCGALLDQHLRVGSDVTRGCAQHSGVDVVDELSGDQARIRAAIDTGQDLNFGKAVDV